MSLNQIPQQHPKAFKQLLDWIDKGWALSEEQGEPVVWGTTHHYSFGSSFEFWQDGYFEGEYHYKVGKDVLVDFFDDENLFLTVTTFRTDEEPFSFIWDIESRETEGLASGGGEPGEWHLIRGLALDAALSKAFELLNARLA